MKTVFLILFIALSGAQNAQAVTKERVSLSCVSPGGAQLKWHLELHNKSIYALRGETVNTAFDMRIPKQKSQGTLDLESLNQVQKVDLQVGRAETSLAFKVTEQGPRDVVKIRGRLKGESVSLNCQFEKTNRGNR